MLSIQSGRLTLLPLNHHQLLLWQQNRHQLEEALGLKPSDMQIAEEFRQEMADALPFWLAQTQAHPEQFMWGTNWEIILTADQLSIGGIGLAGLPNEAGEVTVGYLIDAKYHRKGYASEALACLLDWVWQHKEVTTVLADTPIDNLGSQGVLRKQGFTPYKEEEGIIFWKRRRS
jgi:[ribosomal protein S5]-alanine N-acetyltransferase